MYFQINLIDMSKYSQYNSELKWIFTLFGLFTKKVFTISLKNKEESTITAALATWILGLTHTLKIIQFDRRLEFVNRDIQMILQKFKIKHLLSLLHSPKS